MKARLAWQAPCLAALFALLALLALSTLAAGSAAAQSWPTKPVRLISPFPPGSSADVMGRLFAPKLAEAFGQQFLVDNRAGAAGNIGAEAAARSAPDGYTYLIEPSAIASTVSLYKDLTFNLERDFDAVAMLTTSSYVLVVSPKSPVKTVKELITLARANPGKLNFASTGTGGAIHLTTAMFMMATGTQMVHVPYKGGLAAVADLNPGQIDLMFATTQTLLPQVKSGRARALAISTPVRSAAAPDIPTVAEAGVPGFESSAWLALVAPKGTPREAIARMNGTVGKIGQMPDVLERFNALGAEVQNMAPAQVAAFIHDEIAKWAKVVQAAGVTLE